MRAATRKVTRGLGFPHLKPTIQKLVWQHIKWTRNFSKEIRKVYKLIDKENTKQYRRDDRRDIARKNEIFKN